MFNCSKLFRSHAIPQRSDGMDGDSRSGWKATVAWYASDASELNGGVQPAVEAVDPNASRNAPNQFVRELPTNPARNVTCGRITLVGVPRKAGK